MSIYSIIESLVVGREDKLPSGERTRLNRDFSTKSFGTYFISIPIKEIAEVLSFRGLTLLQEDATEWSGFLTGNSGRATFDIAYTRTARQESYGIVYTAITNTSLVLSWYRMDSGKYEITVYLS